MPTPVHRRCNHNTSHSPAFHEHIRFYPWSWIESAPPILHSILKQSILTSFVSIRSSLLQGHLNDHRWRIGAMTGNGKQNSMLFLRKSEDHTEAELCKTPFGDLNELEIAICSALIHWSHWSWESACSKCELKKRIRSERLLFETRE